MTFTKGQSGNPGGRPKRADDVREMARSHTGDAIKRLAHWMKSDDARASVSASQVLIERGWGKPQQDNTHTLQGEVRVVLRKMLDDEERDE